MDNIFKDLNHCCLSYIDDILVFSKTIEQRKNDILVVTQRCINHVSLVRNKCMYAKQEIEFLGLEIEVGQIILQKHILGKIENFFEKIEDKKQLERFLVYLTSISDFIKDLDKLRKPLQ